MQTRKPLTPSDVNDDQIFSELHDLPTKPVEEDKLSTAQQDLKELTRKTAKASGFTSREEKKVKYSKYTGNISFRTKDGIKEILDEMSFYTKKKKQEVFEEMIGLFLKKHNLKQTLEKFENNYK